MLKNRPSRLLALTAGATLSLGLFAGAAHANRLTINNPTIDPNVNPCVVVPTLCDPPPGIVVTPTTMPPTPTTTVPTPPTTAGNPDPGDTVDPLPPAGPAPVVTATPTFTG
jgi:hypothetical protein